MTEDHGVWTSVYLINLQCLHAARCSVYGVLFLTLHNVIIFRVFKRRELGKFKSVSENPFLR